MSVYQIHLQLYLGEATVISCLPIPLHGGAGIIAFQWMNHKVINYVQVIPWNITFYFGTQTANRTQNIKISHLGENFVPFKLKHPFKWHAPGFVAGNQSLRIQTPS